MMLKTLPVVAIVGRPNVGKSTLFNVLTQTRDALTSAYPGTTRDRQYGHVNLYDFHFILIDTGGLSDENADMTQLINHQAKLAIAEADHVFFMLDAKADITAEDMMIADIIRRS